MKSMNQFKEFQDSNHSLLNLSSPASTWNRADSHYQTSKSNRLKKMERMSTSAGDQNPQVANNPSFTKFRATFRPISKPKSRLTMSFSTLGYDLRVEGVDQMQVHKAVPSKEKGSGALVP